MLQIQKHIITSGEIFFYEEIGKRYRYPKGDCVIFSDIYKAVSFAKIIYTGRANKVIGKIKGKKHSLCL